MKLIGMKHDFFVYFVTSDQKYIVFKGKKQIASGFSYSSIKSYLD